MFTAIHTWEIVMLAVGGLLALGGAGLLAGSFLLDRGRGRRRCPRCWYNMDGIEGLTCPECGRVARSARQLHRTRRRWRLAVASFAVLALGVALGATPSVRRNGAESLIPTTAVIALLPRLDHGFSHRLLGPRIDAGMWGWQQRWLASASIMLLDSPDVARRRSGAELLRRLAPQPSPALLARRLADRDRTVREMLSIALLRSAAAGHHSIDGESGSVIGHAAAVDVDESIGQRIAESLGYLGDPGLAALQEILHHEDPYVRARAMTGLRRQAARSEEAVTAILMAMSDRHHAVRQRAVAVAATAIPPQHRGRVIEALRRAEFDRHWMVRAAAVHGRERLEREAEVAARFAAAEREVP